MKEEMQNFNQKFITFIHRETMEPPVYDDDTQGNYYGSFISRFLQIIQ